MDIFIQKVGENEKLEFTPFFTRLFLPVDQWILTELMDDWRIECEKKVSRETFIQFKNLSKTFLGALREDTNYDITWVESVIYISLHLMARSFESTERIPWIRDISNNSALTVEANLFVAGKLKELYEKWIKVDDKKGEKLAQPFAFYLLISCIANDDKIIKAINGAPKKEMELLSDYLNCRLTGDTNFENRLTLFAVDFFQNGNKIISENDQSGLNTIGHFELLNINKVKIDRIINDSGKINILAMGIPGSGKSTIIKMVRHVLAAPKDNRIKTSMFSLPITHLSVIEDTSNVNNAKAEDKNFFGSLSNRANPSFSNIKEFTGEIKIGSSQFRMSFYDTKGGIMVETPLKYESNIADEDIKTILEKQMTVTDLLLVILDPETVFYKDDSILAFENILEFIATRLDYLFHYSKHAMIALVFAKFDEYGTIIRGPRNLIHNDSQVKCLKRFIENNTESNWNSLLKEISKSYLLYGENSSLEQRIVQLLERIKYLLTAICSTKKHPVVNCYISSSAIMKDLKNSLWTGYPEIFNDFSNYMDWLIQKKEAQKFDAPSAVIGGVTKDFKVELKWSNPNNRDLFGIVTKKDNSDIFKPVGKAMPIKSNSDGSYIDNFVDYNNTYSYQIVFIDNLEDQNSSKYSTIVNINIPPKPSPRILPPTNLQCRYTVKNQRIFLEWGNENVIDVLNRLEKRENEGAFKLLFERPQGGSAESYYDVDIDLGKTYFYRILSLESANPVNTSTPVEVGPVRTPPIAVKQIKCEVKPNAQQPEYIEISWQESKNSYEIEYQILKQVKDSNGSEPFQNISDQFKNNLYRDNDIKRGCSYQYQIVTKETFTKLESQAIPSENVFINRRDITSIIIVCMLILALIVLLYYTYSG